MKSHNFLKQKFLEIQKNQKFLWNFFLDLISEFVISLLLMAIKQVSEFERSQIGAYNDCGLSFHDIAKKLNHHYSLIDVFLKKTGNYQKKKKKCCGHKKKKMWPQEKKNKTLHLKIEKLLKQQSGNTLQNLNISKLKLNIPPKTSQCWLHEFGFSSVF